ncbi:MAG: fasciclin domain-containing protein [Ginsengibacter sp.]
MKKIKLLAICSLAIFAACTSSNKMKKMDGMDSMNKTVMVGGAEMFPSKNIVENAVNSKDHTTLVAAVKAAGLVETLSSAGPFTVFAPVNQAFDALPAGTVETLLKPENKAKLTSVLTYHVVPGKLNSWDLMKMIKEGNGSASLTTVQGEKLTIKSDGSSIMVTDENGGTASVTIADVNQSNGVIHVINKVLLPK